jgi:hypothetical protein
MYNTKSSTYYRRGQRLRALESLLRSSCQTEVIANITYARTARLASYQQGHEHAHEVSTLMLFVLLNTVLCFEMQEQSTF